MTFEQFSSLLNSGWPLAAVILGWVASHFTTKAQFEARIKALENESIRFKIEDYQPHKAAVDEQHKTIYGKIDAFGSQLNEIVKTMTEVKTIVTMMNKAEK